MEPRRQPASSGPARGSKGSHLEERLETREVAEGRPTGRPSSYPALTGPAALWTPASASADIPWSAGCTPPEEGVTRTAAICGATLIDGEAIPPPEAPAAVKQVIRTANEIHHRPYVWAVAIAAGSAAVTTAQVPSATRSTELACSR